MRQPISSTPMGNILRAGLKQISGDQKINFTKYKRTVMPIDGFVFWIKQGGPTEILGSLHISTRAEQKEESNYDLSSIILSTMEEIRQFHDLNQDTVWVGDFEGVKFAIGSRSPYYKNAGEYHYLGQTIIPAFETQFKESVEDLSEKKIVSNSLPFFLDLAKSDLPFVSDIPFPKDVEFFPSFLVPDNRNPPYVSIHNPNRGVTGQSYLSGSKGQFVKERVTLILYGLDSEESQNLRNRIIRYGLLNIGLGISNAPEINDFKENLPEIGALSMKKIIELDVNYWQADSSKVAQRFIRNAKVNWK